jgi:hypothetical protein
MSEKKKGKATNTRDRSFLAAFDWIEPRGKEEEMSERERRMAWRCAPLIGMLILIQMSCNGSSRIYPVKEHYLPKDSGSLVIEARFRF